MSSSVLDLGIEVTPREAVATADGKRLINCATVDVNQLMPLKYEWAWEHNING